MKKLLAIYAAAAALFISCEKPEESNDSGSDADAPVTEAPLIGKYTYDGKEYPVYTAVYSEDESNIMIVISPLQGDTALSTYAMIGIKSSHEGKTIDVAASWHNDDYYFRYEDPLKYYSEYRKLTSGSIMVKRHNNDGDTFDVIVDVILPDGVGFNFEYSGPIASATP